MAEDVDARGLHRRNHPSRLIRRDAQRRMRRRDDELELRELGRRHVHRSVGADVRLDPFDQPEGAFVFLVQAIDRAMLLEELRHRDAAGDRQTVRMIRDAAEAVAALDAGRDDLVERLAAVAPRRVHLQIAAIVGEARSDELRVPQRCEHLRAAQEMPAQIALPLDVRCLVALGDRALHRRRRAGLQHLEDHAARRRADVGDLAERAVGLQQRLDRLLERQDRPGGALVAPHALLRLLHGGEVPQQRRDLPVHVDACAHS